VLKIIATNIREFQALVDLTSKVLEGIEEPIDDTIFNVQLLLSINAEGIYDLIDTIGELEDPIDQESLLENIATDLCKYQAVVDLSSKVLEEQALEDETIYNVRLLLSSYARRMDEAIREIREFQDQIFRH